MNPQRILSVLDTILAELRLPPAIITDCLAAFRRVYREFQLTPVQQREAVAPFLAELARRLPQFLTAVAVTSQLPLIGERARRRFSAAGESPENAEDLGQDVVLQILHAFFGNGPRGNVGALVATITKHVSCDRHRRRSRDEKVMARARDERRAAGC